jgi:hypothetical protein
MTPRRLLPRPPVTAAPLVVSDLTCLDLVGLTADQYRALLRRHPEVPRATLGHRVLVRADVFLALLDRLASQTTHSGTLASDSDADDAPLTADAVLAAVGMRRSA